MAGFLAIEGPPLVHDSALFRIVGSSTPRACEESPSLRKAQLNTRPLFRDARKNPLDFSLLPTRRTSSLFCLLVVKFSYAPPCLTEARRPKRAEGYMAARDIKPSQRPNPNYITEPKIRSRHQSRH